MKRLLTALEKAQAAAKAAVGASHRKPAARRLDRQRCLFFDLETTGPDPAEAFIVQIALTLTAPDEEPQTYSTVVNPGVPIPREATAVHRISTDQARRQPLFLEQARTVGHLLSQADVCIAYNGLRFDRQILQREIDAAGSTIVIPPMVDPFVWASWKTRARPLTLGELAHSFGVNLSAQDAHTAAGDVAALIELTGRMVEAGEIPKNVDAALEYQGPIAEFIGLERQLLGGLVYLDRETAAVRCGGKKHRGQFLRDVDGGFIDWCLKLDDLEPLAREILARTRQERATGRAA